MGNAMPTVARFLIGNLLIFKLTFIRAFFFCKYFSKYERFQPLNRCSMRNRLVDIEKRELNLLECDKQSSLAFRFVTV